MRRMLSLCRVVVLMAGMALGDLGVRAQETPPRAGFSPGSPQTSHLNGLRFAKELRPVLDDSDPARPLFLRADQVFGRIDRDLTLQGGAEVRRAGTVVRADRLSVYQDDQTLIAVGQVHLAGEGVVVRGPQLQLRLDRGGGLMPSPSFDVPQTGGRGWAREIEWLGRNYLHFSDAFYTSCRADDPDWYLKAESLSLDGQESVGVARSATLYFKDWPLLTTPYFAFPMGQERRSGFLPPTLSMTSTTGGEVRMPYYFNIAPNRDLTLFTTVSARRGLHFGGTARYLEPTYRGTSDFEYTAHDVQLGQSRWLLNSQHFTQDLLGWQMGWLLRGVSDDRYFVDYSRSIAQSAERSLPRDVFIERRLGAVHVRARMLQYQNILEARAAPPYNRLPQMTLAFRNADWHGFDVSSSADLSVFSRDLPGSAEGARLMLQPAAAYTFGDPGRFITPRASLHATAYRLEANPSGATHLDRVVPTVSLDSGLVFERPVRWGGRAQIQTLEPRLLYVYTPYRDQTQIPVFDSAFRNLGFAALFSENIFSGGDRIADANQITAGAISRLIDPDTGSQFLRLAIAQRLYFNPQGVTLPGVPSRTDAHSDVLLAAAGDFGRGHRVDLGLQWSVGTRAIPRGGLAWHYWPAQDRVLNFALRYQQRDYAQVDTSWRWPLSRRWHTLGRFNVSVLREQINPADGQIVAVSPQWLEGVLGFEYQADCWITRFVAQRFVTATSIQTTAFFVQLELAGLGRIGLDPFDILTRNIPGYRTSSPNAVTPSPYHGYP